MKHFGFLRQYGVSIIEVLLAMLIFSGALIALANFQAKLLRERTLIDQQFKALTLAQNKMQTFQNYTTIETSTDQMAYNDIQTGSSVTTDNNTIYSVIWSVTDSATDSLPIRKNVAITVSFRPIEQTTDESVTINSIIAKISPEVTGKVAKNLP